MFIQLLGKYGASSRLLHKVREVTEDRPGSMPGVDADRTAGSYRTQPSGRRLGAMLSSIAGADPDLLEPMSGERVRYQTLGAAILLSTITATVLFVIVLSSFLGVNVVAASVLGLLWGAVILNFDRWMATVDLSVERRRNLLLHTVPRLMIGVVIGITTSSLLILAVFRPAIDAQLAIRPNLLGRTPGLLDRLEALEQLSAAQPAVQLGRWSLVVLIIALDSAPILVVLALRLRAGAYETTVSLRERFSPTRWGLDNMHQEVRRRGASSGTEPDSDPARELAAMAARIEELAAEIDRAEEKATAEIIDLDTRRRRAG
ncbi:DUF4407 domain-containing protein [Microbispora bryophytorum]|uniref:DUF4407 domain-containing protein n=1 Tax=Microbispora bryophytorum subsp. camponoti TaxID=1677852 RepID=A0ABR8KUL3_9ACTN|nr:DUF4407 domain-containing protein [Microbispora camponoti]MBD3142447.1 DUF4407 domain-containing protein [Microbispora camponoti]